MSRGVRFEHVSAGYQQVLGAPGTREAVAAVARSVASGVRSCPSHVRAYNSFGRHIAIVGLDPEGEAQAYDGRRELEAAL